MAETYYDGTQYKLRAGAPMSKGELAGGDFYVHTFKAEKNAVKVYTYIDDLPKSSEFRGQILETSTDSYIAASFSRLQDTSGNVFSGNVTYNVEYIDEDAIGT